MPYPDDADLSELIEHAWQLRQEKKDLEAAIDHLNGLLMQRLHGEKTFSTDQLSATVVHRQPRLKIKSAAALPPEFLSLQPDKKRLDAHFTETGEIVDGTELTQPTAYVTVRERKGS